MDKTHLRAVTDHPDEYDVITEVVTDSGLPDFEGQPVDFARLKLASAANLEVDDSAFHIDDIVRLYVEGRVTRVDHATDKVSSKLKRIHTVTVVDAIQLPWDFDTGTFAD